AVVGGKLEQALVGGQQAAHLAAALLDARGDHVLNVLERGVAFRASFRIEVGDLHQRGAIARFSRIHPRLEVVRRIVLARQCRGTERNQQRGEQEQQGRATPLEGGLCHGGVKLWSVPAG